MVRVEPSDIIVKFIPATHWWKKSTWELVEPYHSMNGHVTVQPGFVTDGASIPSMFKNIFRPTGRYFGAAIVHDFILDSVPQPPNKEEWEYANAEFKEEMTNLKIMNWRRDSFVLATKAYAWLRVKIVNRFVKTTPPIFVKKKIDES